MIYWFYIQRAAAGAAPTSTLRWSLRHPPQPPSTARPESCRLNTLLLIRLTDALGLYSTEKLPHGKVNEHRSKERAYRTEGELCQVSMGRD